MCRPTDCRAPETCHSEKVSSASLSSPSTGGRERGVVPFHRSSASVSTSKSDSSPIQTRMTAKGAAATTAAPEYPQQGEFFKYARRFAFVTLLTAYLGKHANHHRSHFDMDGASGGTTPIGPLIALGNGSGLLGLGLYEYFAPGLVATLSSKYIVYLLLLYLFLDRCRQAFNYHMSNLRRATSEAIQSATSMQTLSRIRSTVSTTCVRLCIKGTSEESSNCSNDNSTNKKRIITISAPDSFLSPAVMEHMTLRDVAHVFSYAMQVNQRSFDRAAFLRETRTPAKQAIQALDEAVTRSRGGEARDVVTLLETPSDSGSGDMDALAFCAASRIFAEWRGIRAVPEGFPKYAFGMSLARRDLIQNVAKVERSVHQWLDFYQGTTTILGSNSSDNGRQQPQPQIIRQTSPTVRQLLQHELEINLHPKLPNLVESSAASGILWTKRQLQYQSYAMENNSRVPVDFPSPKAAFSAAYEAVYSKYHGFLVRTVFQSTFDCAPPAAQVIRHMNLPYLEDAEEAAEDVCSDTVQETLSENDDDDDNNNEEDETWLQLPIEQEEEQDILHVPTDPLGEDHHQVQDEHSHDMDLGERVLQLFTTLFGHCVAGKQQASDEVHESRNMLAGIHPSNGALGAGDERNKSTSLPSSNGRDINDVPYYLSVVRSMEDGLDSLIAELNMNDPAKV